MKYGNQNARRVERAINELIKIQDSGKGTGEIQHILDLLDSLKYHYLEETFCDCPVRGFTVFHTKNCINY